MADGFDPLFVTLLILLTCALLEAGGDALMRKGIHAVSFGKRLAFYAAAALVLSLYGWLVNKPSWQFSSLLGVYVVLFFVVAQVIGVIVFGDRMTPALWIGGALIAAGGAVITFANR